MQANMHKLLLTLKFLQTAQLGIVSDRYWYTVRTQLVRSNLLSVLKGPSQPCQTYCRRYHMVKKIKQRNKAICLMQLQRLLGNDSVDNTGENCEFEECEDTVAESKDIHEKDEGTETVKSVTWHSEKSSDELDKSGKIGSQQEMPEKKNLNGFYPQGCVEEFLTENEMLFTKGFTGVFTVCPKLGKLAMKRKSEKDRMYIDSTSGYFHCSHCGKSGLWPQLRDNIVFLKLKKANKNTLCFKDITEVTQDAREVHPEVSKQLEDVIDFSELGHDTFDSVLSLFDWNGIARETFIKYGVKYKVKDGVHYVLFPIQSSVGGVPAVHVYRGKILEDGDVKILPMLTYPRTKDIPHVFGWQTRDQVLKAKKDTLVITISEVNAMAIFQTTQVLALSLKSMMQLPQELLPHIESFSKVILWIGTDMNAWENTKIFAKKLFEKRCYIYRPNALQHMPLEVLQHDGSVREVLDMARLMSHQAIVTFENMRQEVFSEFAHHKQVAGVQWKRFSKLNTLLKGHRRGELTVLTGPTGSGKTTFMAEYSLDLCMQGVNTLWGSFEISNVRLMKIMLQQFAGKSLSKHQNEFDEIADEFSRLPLYYMMYFGAENINKILEAMSNAVYVHDIGHVILDNLQFMMGMDFTPQNRFFIQDQFVSKFRKFATEKNCHVTLIIHPRKVNDGEELSTASIFGSAKVTQEADNVLLIQDQRLSKPSGRKYLQVAKNRFDGDLGVMTLNFNKESLSFHTVEKRKQTKLQEQEGEEDMTSHGCL